MNQKLFEIYNCGIFCKKSIKFFNEIKKNCHNHTCRGTVLCFFESLFIPIGKFIASVCNFLPQIKCQFSKTEVTTFYNGKKIESVLNAFFI